MQNTDFGHGATFGPVMHFLGHCNKNHWTSHQEHGQVNSHRKFQVKIFKNVGVTGKTRQHGSEYNSWTRSCTVTSILSDFVTSRHFLNSNSCKNINFQFVSTLRAKLIPSYSLSSGSRISHWLACFPRDHPPPITVLCRSLLVKSWHATFSPVTHWISLSVIYQTLPDKNFLPLS